MQFTLLSTLSTLAAVAVASIHPGHVQRASKDFQLLTYGIEASANPLPVFYCDGLAYIGNVVPVGCHDAKNVTFSTASYSVPSAWAITPHLASNWTMQHPVLYIDTTPNAYAPVGFADKDTTNATTTGFFFFGAIAMRRDDAGDITSSFYAAPTKQDGLYILKWNQDNVDNSLNFAVALKRAT